jgi:hypothetical protein
VLVSVTRDIIKLDFFKRVFKLNKLEKTFA